MQPLEVISAVGLIYMSLGVKGLISIPVTGLDRPRGLQEVKVPRFHDNGTGWW